MNTCQELNDYAADIEKRNFLVSSLDKHNSK